MWRTIRKRHYCVYFRRYLIATRIIVYKGTWINSRIYFGNNSWNHFNSKLSTQLYFIIAYAYENLKMRIFPQARICLVTLSVCDTRARPSLRRAWFIHFVLGVLSCFIVETPRYNLNCEEEAFFSFFAAVGSPRAGLAQYTTKHEEVLCSARRQIRVIYIS